METYINPCLFSVCWNHCRPNQNMLQILRLLAHRWKSSHATRICGYSSQCSAACEAKMTAYEDYSEILALLFMCSVSLSPSAVLFSALPLQHGPRSGRLRLPALILQHSPASFIWPWRATMPSVAMLLVPLCPLWLADDSLETHTQTHTFCHPANQ